MVNIRIIFDVYTHVNSYKFLGNPSRILRIYSFLMLLKSQIFCVETFHTPIFGPKSHTIALRKVETSNTIPFAECDSGLHLHL